MRTFGKLVALQVSLMVMLLGQSLHASIPKAMEFDLHDGKVDFLSIGHPAAIKIHGEGSKLEGKMTIRNRVASGNLVFDLDSLDTDINLRNEHMKEKYLETSKFKNAELTIEKLSIPAQIFTADGKAVAVPFSGILSLHGAKHPIQGTSEVRLVSNKLTGKADFEIKLSDYQIAIPTYLGVTVADTVNVSVNFSADGKERK